MISTNPTFELQLYTPPLGNEVDFNLYIESLGRLFLGFNISGKIGKPSQPDPAGVNGIWQMRMTKNGKKPLKMKFYQPYNPQTEAQEANRSKFANAMIAWGSLTSEQKEAYTKRAKRRSMFGWGLFIREYYQAN